LLRREANTLLGGAGLDMLDGDADPGHQAVYLSSIPMEKAAAGMELRRAEAAKG